MAENPKNISEIFEEAKLDNVWFERLKSVKSEGDLYSVLEEKGIKLNDELKKMLFVSNIGKNKELLDDELDQVSGGFDWEDFERFRQFLGGCKIQL